GEGPGRQENNMKVPFVGKTGDELNGTYFLLSGDQRENVYLTNAFKCHWADSSDTPSWEVIQSCANWHLKRELAEVQPKLVVLMGGIAARLAGFDLEMEHGFIHPDVNLLGHRCDVFCTYHPALGMHKSSAMLALLEDFKNLKRRVLVPEDKY